MAKYKEVFLLLLEMVASKRGSMCVVGWEEPLPSRGAGTGLNVIRKVCRNDCVVGRLAGHFRELMP